MAGKLRPSRMAGPIPPFPINDPGIKKKLFLNPIERIEKLLLQRQAIHHKPITDTKYILSV